MEKPNEKIIDRTTCEDTLDKLNRIGKFLSSEKDPEKLSEIILNELMDITNADGGTLYMISEDEKYLEAKLIRTDSLGLLRKKQEGLDLIAPIPLHQSQMKCVAVAAALKGKTMNIDDMYHEQSFDFSGSKNFDKQHNYRTKSLLTIPLIDNDCIVMGVLQLINATNTEEKIRIPFSQKKQETAESLASQASIYISNQQRIKDLKTLIESIVMSNITALGIKSPHTADHCKRVPILTMMIADFLCNETEGVFRNFAMNKEEKHRLRVSAQLHDVGKIATPDYLIEKASKLEMVYDILHEIRWRFTCLKKEAKTHLDETHIQFLKAQMNNEQTPIVEELKKTYHTKLLEYEETMQQLADDEKFLQEHNTGRKEMTPKDQGRVRDIASYQVDSKPFLSEKEVECLSIPRGTVTKEEKDTINKHVEIGVTIIQSLAFPGTWKDIATIVGGHHEKIDGTGYPNGLTKEELSVQSRIMALADIFEALTAIRPYKEGMSLSKSLGILKILAKTGHIDPDIFLSFIKNEIYLQYAKKYMAPEQIDTDNLSLLLEEIEKEINK